MPQLIYCIASIPPLVWLILSHHIFKSLSSSCVLILFPFSSLKEHVYFQGRIPWIVGGDPATGLAHPLSHPYPGASHYPPPGHHPAYPLLPVMPPQPGQAADTWGAIGIGLPAQHQHPGHPGQALPPSTGAVTATNDAVSGAAPYKLDPDAMQAAVASAAATASMYYPAHQVSSP
jgi:hypothetical protein